MSHPEPPKTLDPVRVHELADQLLSESVDIDAQVWSEAANERHRSAISRSYYATLLALCDRLIEDAGVAAERLNRPDIHGKMLKALPNAIGRAHRLNGIMRGLRDDRGDADYKFRLAVTVEFAEDRVDIADTAIELIDEITDDQLTRLAAEF